jgi:hypothetical protein
MLVAGVLGSTAPGGTVSAAERASPESITQLMLLFFSDVSRVLVPKRVVAEDKEWKIVKDAEQQQDARKSQEDLRREAYKRLEEQEREARRAREEYRRETRNLLHERQFPWLQPADEQGREGLRAREERLRAAERRMHERERQAQRAKEEYQVAARMAREERRREAERPRIGG